MPIWARHGVSRLSDLERRSGRTVRRIETTQPGELVHLDVKKQAKIPKGGGWRVHGRSKEHHGGPTASAMPTSTRPSTPTAAWPTQRSTTTKRLSRHRFLASGQGLLRHLRHHGRAGADRQRQLLSAKDFAAELAAASPTTSPGPIAPRPTERSSATTGPSSTSGPMPAPTAQRPPEPGPWTLAPHVQPSPAPHGYRGPTHQPRQQRGWAEQLDPYPATIRRVPIPTWSQLDQGGVTERRIGGMARPRMLSVDDEPWP